jgi:hypothetical protein
VVASVCEVDEEYRFQSQDLGLSFDLDSGARSEDSVLGMSVLGRTWREMITGSRPRYGCLSYRSVGVRGVLKGKAGFFFNL